MFQRFNVKTECTECETDFIASDIYNGSQCDWCAWNCDLGPSE